MLRHGHNLAVQCQCGHVGVVDGKRFARLFFVRRWDARVHMIGAHLRCSKCGGRPKRFDVTYRAPDGPAWGPRSEADWKRLMANLRG